MSIRLSFICRACFAVLLAQFLAACASIVKFAPEARPRVEAVTIAGNKSPYTVFGETYYVMPIASGYRELGIASWYGTKFHGRNTSNGERYNMYAVSAAHKTLPIPSYVRVTNLDNNRELVVRVNDRGPFHQDRIIDLSYAAAVKLGFAKQGIAHVLVEVIDTGAALAISTPVPAAPAAIPLVVLPPAALPDIPRAVEPARYLQVGLFTRADAAEQLVERLADIIELPVKVNSSDQFGKHIVAIGPIESDAALEKTRMVLLFEGIDGAFLIYGLE